jgi:hypothetical protein
MGRTSGLAAPALLPSLVNRFDGMSFLDSVNGYVPPDTDMAVGPTFVVETINAQIQFYARLRRLPYISPDLRPTRCMELTHRINGKQGQPVSGVIHNTIHGSPAQDASSAGQPAH